MIETEIKNLNLLLVPPLPSLYSSLMFYVNIHSVVRVLPRVSVGQLRSSGTAHKILAQRRWRSKFRGVEDLAVCVPQLTKSVKDVAAQPDEGSCWYGSVRSEHMFWLG